MGDQATRNAKYLGRFLGLAECVGEIPDNQVLDALVKFKDEHDDELRRDEVEATHD
jgi:hypothetical protein